MHRIAMILSSYAVITRISQYVLPVTIILSLLVFAGCGGSKKVTQTEAATPVLAEPEAPAEVKPKEEVKIEPKEEVAPPAPLVLENVYFDFDKYDITPAAAQTLAMNARGLKDHSGVKIVIEGHCDERGTIEYNLALGDRRAKAVKDYLVSLGIDPSRIFTISYGKERPVDPRHNEEAWAKNRRAEFVRR